MMHRLTNWLAEAADAAVRRSSVEHTIDVARTLFAAASLAIILLDPLARLDFASVPNVLLLAYIVYSLVLLFTSNDTPSRRRLLVSYTVDVTWPAVMCAFGQGVNSPFFLFYILVLLTTAYRFGLFQTLLTAVVSVLLLWLQSIVAIQLGLTADPGPKVTMMRSAYLIVIALLIGFISQSEKQQRDEEGAIIKMLAKAASKPSFRQCLHSVLSDLIKLSGAKQAVVSMLDLHSQEFTVAELWAGGSHHQMLVRTSTDTQEAKHFNFLPEDTAAVFHRGEVLMNASRTLRMPAEFDARYEYKTAATVPFQIASSMQGCAFVLDPREPNVKSTLHFLTRAFHRALPAIYSNYLVKQLRNRASAIERGRLARELHDGSIQSLSGVEMRLYVLRHTLLATAQEALSAEVRAVQELVHAEIVKLRQLTHQIRPEEDVSDIHEALTNMVERFRDSGVAARYIPDAPHLVLGAQATRELVSIAKEALTNIRKHSRATDAAVRLSQSNQNVVLTIEDNGSGFDFVGRLNNEELRRTPHGPLVIKERVRSLGGELAIESYPGRGARLEITLPAGGDE